MPYKYKGKTYYSKDAYLKAMGKKSTSTTTSKKPTTTTTSKRPTTTTSSERPTTTTTSRKSTTTTTAKKEKTGADIVGEAMSAAEKRERELKAILNEM